MREETHVLAGWRRRQRWASKQGCVARVCRLALVKRVKRRRRRLPSATLRSLVAPRLQQASSPRPPPERGFVGAALNKAARSACARFQPASVAATWHRRRTAPRRSPLCSPLARKSKHSPRTAGARVAQSTLIPKLAFALTEGAATRFRLGRAASRKLSKWFWCRAAPLDDSTSARQARLSWLSPRFCCARPKNSGSAKSAPQSRRASMHTRLQGNCRQRGARRLSLAEQHVLKETKIGPLCKWEREFFVTNS